MRPVKHARRTRDEEGSAIPTPIQTVTTLEAARILGVSIFSIQRWFDEGHLKGAKLPGGKRKISATSLRAFMDAHGLLPQGSGAAGRPRVLVVTGDARLAAVLEAELTTSGRRLVRTATGGLDAALSIAEFKPNAVVYDLTGEDLPATMVLGKVRKALPEREAWLVALVSRASPGVVKDLREAGASTVLTKPLNLADLRRALVGMRTLTKA